jgi:rod shape-determining protein MreD
MRSLADNLTEKLLLALPSAVAVFWLCLGQALSQLLSGFAMLPWLILPHIYFWSVFAPSLVSYPLCFVLGIMQDALMGTPLGLSSFLLMFFRYAIVRQRKVFVREAFVAIWLGYAAFSMWVFALAWFIVSSVFGVAAPAEMVMLQWLATTLCYPPMHRLLTRLYAVVPRQE